MDHIHCRNGIYYWRRRVPKDLRSRIGRDVLWRSLDTRNIKAARIAARKLSAAADTVFEQMRAKPSLSSTEIDRVLRDYLESALRDSERHLEERGWKAAPHAEQQKERLEREWSALATDFQNYDDTSQVERLADTLIEERGLPILKDTPEYHSFARRVVMAKLELLKLQMERLEQFYGPIIPPATASPTLSLPQVNGPSVSELARKYVAALEATWTKKTKAQVEQTFRLFSEHLNDKAAVATNRQDVATFREQLAKLPKTYGKSPKDKDVPFSELVLREGEKITPKTIKRHITVLTSFYGWMKMEGLWEGENPASGFKFGRTKRVREERGSWTQAELKTLFASPIWKGSLSARYRSKPGSVVIRDALYWIPLLALYDGLRLEEAAQLRREDIKEEKGIWFFDINAENGRQLKSVNAVRKVPIHSVIVAYGFLDFIKDKKPTDLVFDELKPGGPDKRYGFYVSKKFGTYRKNIGLERVGIDIHALRANFATALQNAEVPESTANELLGHSGNTISYDRYSKGLTLDVLHRAVERVHYSIGS